MSSALQTTTTRDALVAEIRKRILSGELAAGEPLTESGLAAKFKVARPTVRSALQVLASRHLAQQVGGRSLSVPVLGEADVRDLFFARTPVELEAVREIVENDRCLDGGGVIVARPGIPSPRREFGGAASTPTAFHIALVDAVGSTRLSRLYPAIQDEMQLGMAQLHASYPDPQDLAQEHRELLRAVQSGNLDRALAKMRTHLERALHGLTHPEPANDSG